MRVVGVDGAKAQWVAVVLDDGRFGEAKRWRRLVDILVAFRDASIVAVDIPIGLQDQGERPPDRAARQFLGPRWTSVFMTPPRSVLEAPTYEEANARMRALTGGGISRQAYGLKKKILEVDELARGDRRIREVHPEVSFRAMAGGDLRHSKKSPFGFMERWELLRREGIEIPEEAFEIKGVGADDILDAAAAAWSARRVVGGHAKALPEDARTAGEDVAAIWY